MSKINALLQRLMGLLPFRRKPDAETDPVGPEDGDATPIPDATAAESKPDARTEDSLAPGDSDADIEAAIERARKHLVWKKRIIVVVPALLLVVLIASIAAWLLGSADEAEQVQEAESAVTTPTEGGDAKVSNDHAAPPPTAPVDAAGRARELEEQLKQMEQERNALLMEKNALAERNRKLQEAAARRAARPDTQPRSRSSLPASTIYSSEGDNAAGGDSADTATSPSSVDCTISGDLATAGELLKRCIEEFNAASEGR